jgi:hypothetical protein
VAVRALLVEISQSISTQHQNPTHYRYDILRSVYWFI